MNRKGFTIIELLGVVVVIAILLSIAMFGASMILINAKKSIYVNNAKEFLKAARYEIMRDRDRFRIDDPNTTYYIHIKNFQSVMEKDLGSPFADWKEAYVVVAMDDNKNFIYGWASQDKANYTVKTVTELELDREDVVRDGSPLNTKSPLGARTYVVTKDKNGNTQPRTTQSTEMTRPEADECFSYELTDSGKKAKITYYKEECGPDVVIPGVIDGYQVVEIYTYSFYKKGLRSVVIPDGVTTIGSCAFQSNSLTRIVLPQSLVTIGNEAFDNNKIPTVEFPEGYLTSIGARAFRSNQLHTYEIPESVETVGACAFCKNPLDEPAFTYLKGDKSAITGYMGDLSEFKNKTFVIPAEKDGVPLKTIKSGAFRSLAMTGWKVIIPNTVETVESDAFWYDHVAEFSIFTDAGRSASHLKTIGSQAFYANDMTTLYIPNSVQSIGNMAFQRNKVTTGDKFIYKRDPNIGGNHIDYSTLIGYSVINDTNVVIPSNVTTLSGSAFRYANLKGTISIPQSVTSIGQLAFSLNYLTDVNNGTGDSESAPFVYVRDSSKTGGFDKTKILSYANYGVNTVTVPEGVIELKPYSFYYSNIKHVNLPNSLTTIGSYSFQICHLTGTVTIPPNVTYIGTSAFPKYKTWTSNNGDMTEIVNKTGRSFDWQDITVGSEPATFKTGVAKNWYGDVTISKGW